MRIKKFNEEVDKSTLTPNIEEKLVIFFESFGHDRQWTVDRFNDEDTKRFISYMENELIKR